MTDRTENSLSRKSGILTTDYVRVIGAGESYNSLVSDLAETIIEQWRYGASYSTTQERINEFFHRETLVGDYDYVERGVIPSITVPAHNYINVDIPYNTEKSHHPGAIATLISSSESEDIGDLTLAMNANDEDMMYDNFSLSLKVYNASDHDRAPAISWIVIDKR